MSADASRRWRQSHPEAIREQKRLYYARHSERLSKLRAPGNLLRAHKLRHDTIIALGGVCIKCGFSDERALQIDHVNGGGNAERKVLVNRQAFYHKILDDSTGYQLLCANCNWIKRCENNEYRWKTTSTITED